MIAAVLATVQRDRAGRIAVGVVRLGLALMSSGVALLPWPSRANLDALYRASLTAPADFPAAGATYPPLGPWIECALISSRAGSGRSGVSAAAGGVALTSGRTA